MFLVGCWNLWCDVVSCMVPNGTGFIYETTNIYFSEYSLHIFCQTCCIINIYLVTFKMLQFIMMQNILNDLCRVTNRAPMQWSDRHFAGFTTGNSTWTKVSDDYQSVNVEVGC